MERLRFLYADNLIGISHFEYDEDFGAISKELQELHQRLQSHICKGDLTPNNSMCTNIYENMKDNKLRSMESLNKYHESIYPTTDLSIGGYGFMNFLNRTSIEDEAMFKGMLTFHFKASLKPWIEHQQILFKQQEKA